VISLVAASEREAAQTDLVKKLTGVARSGSWERTAEAVTSARSKKPLFDLKGTGTSRQRR
jgi:hypothetical protein